MDHGLFLAYDDVRICAGWSVNVEREQVGRARDMAAAVHRTGHDRDE
jgi:hypothetical protein